MLKNYEFIFTRFQEPFGDRQIDSITSDDVLSFLTSLSKGSKPATKRHRYSSLKAFFNFLKNSIDPGIQNPCDTAMLRKMFRERPPQQWKIVEKDLVDEIIFRTMKPRNRIMLELMARGGMRLGEVLKLTPSDIEDRRLTLRAPKSGKDKTAFQGIKHNGLDDFQLCFDFG